MSLYIYSSSKATKKISSLIFHLYFYQNNELVLVSRDLRNEMVGKNKEWERTGSDKNKWRMHNQKLPPVVTGSENPLKSSREREGPRLEDVSLRLLSLDCPLAVPPARNEAEMILKEKVSTSCWSSEGMFWLYFPVLKFLAYTLINSRNDEFRAKTVIVFKLSCPEDHPSPPPPYAVTSTVTRYS